MKSKTEELCVSDIFKMSALDLAGMEQTRFEYSERRYHAFFEATIKAKQVLADYESGKLQVVARDFAAAQKRVKDRIFDAERSMNLKGTPRHYRREF